MRAAIAVVFTPGAAQRSRTRSPGRGSSSAMTACEPRDCGTRSPPAILLRVDSRRRPGTTSASAGARGPAPGGGSTSWPPDLSSRARAAGSARIVLTRRAVSAGSFIAAINERVPSGPSSLHHISASQVGYEWATAAPSAVASLSFPSSSSRSRMARRRTAFTSPPAAAARRPPRIPPFASPTAWSTAA